MPTNIGLTIARASVAAARLQLDPRSQDCIDTLRELLSAALAEVELLEQKARHRVDLRYLSPCPSGYDTVLGFIAKHNPGLLDLMDRSPEATQRDGFWLRHRCKERNIEPLKVPACPWLRTEHGIETVHAYPIRLLVERLGI